MLILRARRELERAVGIWKNEPRTVALIPTMGALHEGHMALVKIGLEKADKCAVSIFVNPSQFGPREDFSAYPRDETGDLEKLKSAGAHLVYIPSVDKMYPDGVKADIKAGPASQGLESDFRPGHFDGVVSVVSRLFDHVKPDIAVFGEKDFQQLMVIREFVRGNNVPVEIIGGPVIRDEFGLALSSRNAYLSAEELQIARKLNVLMRGSATKDLLEFSDEDPSTARLRRSAQDDIKGRILAAGFDEVQYVEARWGRLLAAVRVGRTRLIDNVELK